MPSDYIFICFECGWSDLRYSNLRKCPKCGAPVMRQDDKIICYHGTTESSAQLILRDGFKPDSWFARHIEEALSVGGATVIAVEFERRKLPKGWQFHVSEAIPPSQIKNSYQIIPVCPRQTIRDEEMSMNKNEFAYNITKQPSKEPITLDFPTCDSALQRQVRIGQKAGTDKCGSCGYEFKWARGRQ